jgi:ubiquinone/menaquinone biosynthesis C-methylase UbiE
MSGSEKYYNQGWFGKHPEIYNKTDVFMKYLRQAAAKKINLSPSRRILDIATGTGAQGVEFSKLGHQVVGVDLDLAMLIQAQNKSGMNLVFVLGDAAYIPTSANTFHLAVISFAMHDVPYEVGVRILKEATRVIKEDGMIYIIEHGDPKQSLAARILYLISLLFETPNYKPFSKRGLKAYFQDAKLKQIRTDFLCLGAVQLLTLKPV